MITHTSFSIHISTTTKIIKLQALSVELELTTGQLVILPGHVPVIGKIGKKGLVTIKESSGTTTVMNLAEGIFALDDCCNLKIISV